MSQRRYARALATVAVLDVDDPTAQPYQARDISSGGLFLLVREQWTVGTTRRLVIEHLTTRIGAEAHVVRSETAGVALEFDDTSEEFRGKIRELLIDLVYEGSPLVGHRSAARFKTTSPVLWVLGSAQYRSTLDDLSPTGATIHASRPPHVGAEIYVQLPIVTTRGGVAMIEEVHGSKANVVRHTPTGFAVRFKGTTEGFRRAVRWWHESGKTK
ncbi:PilZ domain-containing protein [Myxococcota bacterium]